MAAVTFQDKVVEEFDALKTVWDSFNNQTRNFWRTANALDACIELVIAAKAHWAADPRTKDTIGKVRIMVADARESFFCAYDFDKEEFKDGYWWDDYGWWGITWLKLHENYAAIFGSGTPEAPSVDCYRVTQACCLKFAHDCWKAMHDRAWNAYKKDLPVEGGCWNYYRIKGGVQNTVVNVLYLTLSIRLFLATKDECYLKAACEQYKWFVEWFLKGPYSEGDVGIYNCAKPFSSFQPAPYWILERPIDGPDYNKWLGALPAYGTAEGFQDRQQCWTGDQGLFLAGLIGLLQAGEAVADNKAIHEIDQELERAGSKSKTAIKYAEDLVASMSIGAAYLFSTLRPTFVLHEGPMSRSAWRNFYTDYSVGKGVLMRYLAFAFPVLQGLGRSQFGDNVLICPAQSILSCPPSEKNKWGLIWDGWDYPKCAELSRYEITQVGTNEVCCTEASDNMQWNFSMRMARLDALNAAIPWGDQIKVPS